MNLDVSQHFSAILESVKDYAIFTVDTQGVVTTWNAGAQGIFLWEPHEIVGRSAEVLWTVADQAHEGAAKEMETAAREGVAQDRRWHRRKDGTEFFANGTLRPMRDETGTLMGFTKVCRDVTSELATEEALAAARAQTVAVLHREQSRLTEVFQRSPAFMAILRSPQHVFELVNAQFERLVGHRDLLGLPVREALPELAGQGYFELLDGVYNTAEPFVGKGFRVLVQQKRDDTPVERYVDFVYQPMLGEDQQVTGIFVHGVDVTERETAELTAQRLASIVDSSNDAIIGNDANGIVTSWNSAAEHILGYTAEEIIGQAISSIIPVAQQAEEEAIFARILSGERVDHRETVRLTKNGQLLEMSVTTSPIRDVVGRAIGVSNVARDITERKLAEAKLLSSEQRFRQLWATTTDAVVIIDPQQRVHFANPAVSTVFGWSPEEIMTLGMSIFVPERLREAHLRGMARYLETGVRRLDWRAIEIPALHRAGHEFPVEISFSHFKDDGVDLFAAFMRDITDRKQAQEALQRSEASFRQLADSNPEIVWAARPDGYVDYFNKRYYDLTGLQDRTEGDESWQPILHPDDLPRIDKAWSDALKTGEPYELELRLRRAADGQYRWYLSRALPVRDAEGNIIRWFGTTTDIHDRKMLQQENEHLLDSERAARADAERSSRMKDEFLATLSHELRTPLNAILGWSQILRSGEVDPEDLAQGMDVIERNARAQSAIIEDLLDMSRIVSGKVRIEVEQVDLAPLVQAAIESIRPAAEAKGIAIVSAVDSEVGSVTGDPSRLQQIFWNLLSNAVKFTPREGQVQVGLKQTDSSVEISVTDTGEGIDPAFLSHVFERFRQADATSTRKHGGLGLGLAIVKQLVELHGGSVRAESAGAGQGSTFSVMLPLHVSHGGSDAPEQVQRSESALRFLPKRNDPCLKLEGVKVLVVEDEPDAREVVKRLLSQCSAMVTTAGSAEEAMKIIEADLPDVLVSDIGMPGEDGYALIARVRALDPLHRGRIPAIALTAYARSEDRTRMVAAGFDAHVAKPVEGPVLVSMIARLMGDSLSASGSSPGTPPSDRG